jgi:rubrerythrin
MADDDAATIFEQLGQADVLDVHLMELLWKLECSGEASYLAMAELVDDERAQQLLTRNGREEMGHARRIARALSIKLGDEWQPSAELAEPMPVQAPPYLDADILRMIIAAEEQGDAGYQKWADHEPDPEVQRLLRLNGREESLHGERVAEVISILDGVALDGAASPVAAPQAAGGGS